MNLILIIPCFNDNTHLQSLLSSGYFKNNKIDVLVVDDGSNPPVSLLDKNITIIRNEKNRGKGYTLKKGLDYAVKKKYSHAITMDADLQHDPRYIDKFININEEVHLVVGARSFGKEMPYSRRFSNIITSNIISYLCGKKILDSQSGYRRYKLSNRTFYKCIEDGFQFESEILIEELKNVDALIDHVSIPTLYNDEKSSINNVLDTYKFIKLIIRKIIDR